MPDAYADLARSGLTKADARALRVRQLTAAATKRLTKRYHVPSYAIPYFDAQGREIDFYRLRFLEDVEDVEEGKVLRYWQPPRTVPEVYLPPTVDWKKFLAGDGELIITEGEKKAAAGAKVLGKAVVGLGGVFSFKSKAQRVPLLPALVPLVKNRRVVLCFDNDADPNPDVAAARRSLAHAVLRHGADPYKLLLPPGKGFKVGLDDFLVARGAEAFGELELVKVGEEAEFERLNEEVAFIEESHAYYHLATGMLFAEPRRLAQTTFADRSVIVYDQKGAPSEKNAMMEWIKWPNRRSHARLEYEPGRPRLNGGGAYNVWPGWGVEPRRGDASPFAELIEHIFRGAREEHRRWFTSWLAYPLQRPGAKLYTACLLFSLAEGVGKSLVGETMGRIYGRNFSAIQAAQLHSSFNGWAKHRQFVLGDEITGRDRREDIDRLKSIVTQETVLVNEKYQVPYAVADRANYLLTTNRVDALMMAGRDRRFFVHEITADPLPADFYTRYDAWYRSEAGAAALFWHLLHLPLNGFNPRAEAPQTLAKEEMAQLASGPAEYEVTALLRDPRRFLLDSPRDLYTAHEVAALLRANSGTVTTPVAVGRALKAMGARSFVVRLANGGTQRLVAVRNVDRWNRASHAERAAHYSGERHK